MQSPDATRSAFRIDTVGDMTIEWDVGIEVDDGTVLRADIFRPTAAGRYPVILSYGPYGKGLPFKDAMPMFWNKMIGDHPDVLHGSSGKYIMYELVDPELWVPDGYVCIRVDSRGAGRSPGLLATSSPRETQDLYQCIEWAAQQPWSNGRVGLNGISYYAMNQWQVAALEPPHLAAICVWEGAGDLYRDPSYHGGIYTTFVDYWFRAVLATQHGIGERGPRNPHTGQLICGDETLSDEELAANRLDLGAEYRAHPFIDDFHRHLATDWSKIKVPVLSAGNWGGHGLHLRGNTRGFERASSDQKWLDMHGDTHYSLFFAEWGRSLQKRFLGHFLKDEKNGWESQPRVRLSTRHADGETGERTASTWPLPETIWTRFYLDGDGRMGSQAPAEVSSVSYQAGEGRLSFKFTSNEKLEIAGPVAAKLFVESATSDADLFLILRVFAPDGAEIVFQGANDPNTPVSQGWLRASHRALDMTQSRAFLPVHCHEEAEPLAAGAVYEVDVEILPTSLVLPAGYTLQLDIQGHDYAYPPALEKAAHSPLGLMMTGSGPFLHNDKRTRPPEIYEGKITVHTGGSTTSYLMLPVMPS